MSTLTVPNLATDAAGPAQLLRRTAAAVRVHFTWWGTRKALTDAQKEEVGHVYHADSRLLSASKRLVDVRHEAFRRLTAIRTRAVNYWRGLTLPYVEPGVRLIRRCEVEPFVHTMEGLRDELIQAGEELNTAFEEIKADARSRLGRLYNSDDYPAEVRGLFAVDWDFPSVEPPNYLMRLNPEIYRQEQERVAQRFEEAVRLAEQAFLAEFSKLVTHLSERLGAGPEGERKVFRDSAVTNLIEFFRRFQDLNVNSNAQLDALVDQAQQLVRGVAPQDLRDNDALRQHVATHLSQVGTVLDGLLVDRPRRRIVRVTSSANGDSHATRD